MKIKHMIAVATLTAICAGNMLAQTENPENITGPYLEEDTTPLTQEEIKRQAEGSVGKDGQAQWYINMDYAGFDFELPAGTVVNKTSSLTATYPDGTFGVMMKNEELKGANQKEALEVCKRTARELRLGSEVEKAKFGKCDGAMASGISEGQLATVIILPYKDQQTRVVVLAAPERKEWVTHFVDSLKQ